MTVDVTSVPSTLYHDDVIKWKHFPCYWAFLRGIHRLPVICPHKGQWRGALMFSLIWALNKRWRKQSWGWWFETQSRSLRRHCNVLPEYMICTRLRQISVESKITYFPVLVHHYIINTRQSYMPFHHILEVSRKCFVSQIHNIPYRLSICVVRL